MSICRPCRGTGFTVIGPCPFCCVSGVSCRPVEIVIPSHSHAGTVPRAAAMAEEPGADPFAAWNDYGGESGGA